MKKINSQIKDFLFSQSYVILSSIDRSGMPHSACKGVVDIDDNDTVFLLDLYRMKTFENLKGNPKVSITAVDEHRFKGYCLKGKARIMRQEDITSHIIKAWEDRITSRITQRVIKNIVDKKGHPLHPEALFPKPEYMIAVEINSVIDLTPHHMR